MEDFKSITGFKNYLINSEGIIKNIISGKVLSQKPDNSGYPRVFLTDDNGRRRGMLVHRLLAIEFIKNPKNKPCVNHIDGDKANYTLSNLEWTEHKEKTSKVPSEFTANTGTVNKELRDEMIIYLRKKFTREQVAEVFGLSSARISEIVNKL